ncbi:uncharacterized protein LOC131233802 [Magnolia sinica]|uniref:uncharacterized protein LOC131233802 n=1 Tax=Magnolia sinica TaxID=86752 RepID=UPI00265A59FF|nr:uncharacterized protein LOC131233802 [Magnolia sinica]
MASEKRSSNPSAEQRSRSVFDLPSDFFNSCRLLSESGRALSSSAPLEISASEEEPLKEEEEEKGKERKPNPRLSCNTCKADFDSLQDQRSHFKSDIHRFNVKLSLAGKDTVKEEEFDEMTGESLFKDYDISSISGSEDEVEKVSCSSAGVLRKAQESIKQKLFIRLQSGDIVSVWKCLLLNELEDPLFENNKIPKENTGSIPGLREGEFVERLNHLIHEPRDKTHLRIVLLASGGHFAGCVFDGMSIVAHKTFHRYVVRAKAGKKQSSKDATGKAANSAGSSLRRYNEIALKKDVQELLATWKPYFDASLCVFIYAPSNNRKLLFDGEKPHFFHQNCAIQNVPLTVRRPTLKEAKRIYNYLTNMVYEVDEKQDPNVKEDLLLCASDVGKNNQESSEEQLRDRKKSKETPESCSDCPSFSGPSMSAESKVISTSVSANEPTALHDAANSGDAQRTLELLEQGLDPCIKDARGRTPYMLATEKEVRNTFRRFMALNLDKWDWHAANVPSPLTKEMEESQAAKQAEKDAKKKAKSKELKKLRKAKEKAQAQVAPSQISSAIPHGQGASAASVLKGHSQSNSVATMSKEEALAEEREKRAAAAEKRMAALNALAAGATTGTSATPVQKGEGNDVKCSCCMASLAGKVPFHRYNYKYCSTSCMHVHREMLEDG